MRLLIIGDLCGQLGAATQIAKQRGVKVIHIADIEGALSLMRSGSGAELIMIDIKQDIAGLITSLDQEHIMIPVVGCGINDSAVDAAKAIKAGAKEYIPLPPDAELISAVLEAIADETIDLIGTSPEMKKVIALADQVAAAEANILITGESGTGKEVIARYIHLKSKRVDKDFISVNCAAIPENLLESELFGHEKGAFTGAVARRIGKFEEAENSTLLLDEITEISTHLQAKLLRVIQEKEVNRVGSNKPIKLNFRVLATSNRNLQEEVKAGNFREDLFYRLNIITIHLPPLRERKSDINSLIMHFNQKYSELNGVKERSFSPKALEKMNQYNWPGNVRELENTVHRAVLLAIGDVISEEAIILEQELGTSEDAKSSGSPLQLVGRTVDDVEKELIMGTLDHCLGNRTHAANILGISIRTLRNKLKAYSEAS